MQTPQTNQTNKQFTPKTKFLILQKLGCYNTTPPTRDLVPRSRTIRGRGGREKRVDNLEHHQQGTLLHVVRRTSVEKLSVERQHRRKTKPSRDQEEEQQFKTMIKEVLSLKS